jgi:hypothetical protein
MQATKTFDQPGANDPMFRAHDVYNMLYLSFISILDLYYLYQSTDISLIGTPDIGQNHIPLFLFLWKAFVIYMLIDSVWIALFPRIAPSGAKIVLAHHVVTLLYAFVPFYVRSLSWHMGIALLNELSTALVTFRRNVQMDTPLYDFLHKLVLLTWFPIRLGLYPMLCVVILIEYRRYSLEVGTYVNIVAYGVVAQYFLTMLSIKWSIDLINKLKAKKN